MTRLRLATALAAMLTLCAVLPALAHAHLLSADPAANSVVAVAPVALTVQFTEGIEAALAGLSVTRDGVPVPHQAVTADPENPAAVSIQFDVPLAPGLYTVDWEAVAVDGHKSTGSYSFTVAP